MTPEEKRIAAIALGELHAAYLALDSAVSRLHTPLARTFIPLDSLSELERARIIVHTVQRGLHGLVIT